MIIKSNQIKFIIKQKDQMVTKTAK